jgi:hypothetical protein
MSPDLAPTPGCAAAAATRVAPGAIGEVGVDRLNAFTTTAAPVPGRNRGVDNDVPDPLLKRADAAILAKGFGPAVGGLRRSAATAFAVGMTQLLHSLCIDT